MSSGAEAIGRQAIESLIPHADAMCLLDCVIEWNAERIVTATSSHRSPTNPLRSRGKLRALHLCEYGAQAMAIHGGLVARASGTVARPGFLVSLRDVKLHRDFVHDLAGELIVEAHCLVESPGSWQYRFEARHARELLAQGRAAVIARSA